LPLLLDYGPNVSIRQIADAAGIAVGTIFGVFPDKDAVVHAVLEAALDPEPTERELAAIDRTLTFEHQLVDAVRILQLRTNNIYRLVSSLGDGVPPRTPRDFAGLVRILRAGRNQLNTDPVSGARRLRALTFALCNPMFFADEPLTPDEIVAMFLDGVRVRDSGGQPSEVR
jgi:AcrR family transcriptional regulator